MNKALDFLRMLRDDTPVKWVELDEAIKALETENNEQNKAHGNVLIMLNNTRIELMEANERIKELETPKTCDSCKHHSIGKQSDNFKWEKCGWDWKCGNYCENRYEPKDNA